MRELSLNDKVYTPRMLAARISDAKNHSLDPARLLREEGAPQQVCDAFARYEKALRHNNALDFDDLLLKVLELFERFPEVLQRYQQRFRYILVDEYQDTNLAQYHIVQRLAAAHRNLCVVGDDEQSIYGWRGADIRNILEFEKDFPGAKVVRLEQNYRSTGRILDAANRVIAHNASRKQKKLWTAQGEGLPLELYEADDERDEASFVCGSILRGVRQEGRRYGDFCRAVPHARAEPRAGDVPAKLRHPVPRVRRHVVLPARGGEGYPLLSAPAAKTRTTTRPSCAW